MLFVILVQHNATVQDNIVNIPGTWGLPFWGGTTAFLGVYTTLMLNISDYTREYEKSAPNSIMFIIHLIATVPTTLFMALIGLLSAGVTGKWDPIYLFVEIMPNNFMLVMALLFIAVAQITTNVMLNVVPPAYVMMDMFNISYRKGAVVTCWPLRPFRGNWPLRTASMYSSSSIPYSWGLFLPSWSWTIIGFAGRNRILKPCTTKQDRIKKSTGPGSLLLRSAAPLALYSSRSPGISA